MVLLTISNGVSSDNFRLCSFLDDMCRILLVWVRLGARSILSSSQSDNIQAFIPENIKSIFEHLAQNQCLPCEVLSVASGNVARPTRGAR